MEQELVKCSRLLLRASLERDIMSEEVQKYPFSFCGHLNTVGKGIADNKKKSGGN